MNISANQLKLDEDALSLYQELDGIHTEYQNETAEKISAAEKELDALRLQMIETVHSITAWFLDMRLSRGIRKEKDGLDTILQCLEKLAGSPGHDGSLMIRYRGYPTGTGVSAEHDYVISFGSLTADAGTAAALKSRVGTAMMHLPTRMGKAFQTLSEHGISHMYIKIPRQTGSFSREQAEVFRDSLNIIAHFQRSLKNNSPIILEKNGRKTILPLICDERGAGDFNLTLLAGLNNIKPETMQILVRKSAASLKEADKLKKNHPYTGTYEAIIHARNLKDRLRVPPIEINHLKWLCLDENRTRMSGGQVRLARTAGAYFSESPQNTAQIIQSVYGKDYKEISSGHLGQRLRLTTDFLNTVKNKSDDPETEQEVLRNISERFEEIRDEVFDDLIIQKNMLKIRSRHAEPETIGKIHGKLQNIIRHYKDRAKASKKIKDIMRRKIDFDVQDYESLAADFGISAPNVKHLISLLRKCFSQDGHFLRSVFDSHIPDFIRYEKKIFRFLWHYLKETPERNDRIAFLNSFRSLIARMHQPQYALEILLGDVLEKPDQISFSDRNALMLSNLLIRDYYREVTADIEMTPEEVLMGNNGLHPAAAKQGAEMIRRRREDIFRKIRTLNRELAGAAASDEKAGMSIRFLLSLERELHIFLILLGGETALRVLRNALSRYGEPSADIYLSPKMQDSLESVIQHMTVIIRGLEKMGTRDDVRNLRKITQNEGRFLALPMDSRCIVKMRRMMQWTASAEDSIRKRTEMQA